MTEAVLQSPLAGVLDPAGRTLRVDGRSCSLAEIPFDAMLNLRGAAADARFADAVLGCAGLALPLQANTASLAARRQLLWLGPDEWLLKLRDGTGTAVANRLRAALQGLHCAVVEVGDGNTSLRVQGPGAADLLARGCPLDLHPRAFADGALAQTHIARCSTTIVCLQAGVHYEITVRRSFADYLVRWLCEAGAD